MSDIRVIEATLLEQVYRVTLRVQNRGGRCDRYPVAAVSTWRSTAGISGSGVTDQSVTVPGYADAKDRGADGEYGVWNAAHGREPAIA